MNVPFLSQYDDVAHGEWKPRSCTVVCLAMALEALTGETPDVMALIEEGVRIGGHTEHGWNHERIAMLAHNHGVPAYREEFRARLVEPQGDAPSPHEGMLAAYGLAKTRRFIASGGLVIASVARGLVPGGSYHNVLLVGCGEERGTAGFYLHDPDTEIARRERFFIGEGDFASVWRNMAIFIGKTG
jgi:hypothetical protein